MMENRKAELKRDELDRVTGGMEYYPTVPTDDEVPGNNDNDPYPENPQKRPFN